MFSLLRQFQKQWLKPVKVIHNKKLEISLPAHGSASGESRFLSFGKSILAEGLAFLLPQATRDSKRTVLRSKISIVRGTVEKSGCVPAHGSASGESRFLAFGKSILAVGLVSFVAAGELRPSGTSSP